MVGGPVFDWQPWPHFQLASTATGGCLPIWWQSTCPVSATACCRARTWRCSPAIHLMWVRSRRTSSVSMRGPAHRWFGVRRSRQGLCPDEFRDAPAHPDGDGRSHGRHAGQACAGRRRRARSGRPLKSVAASLGGVASALCRNSCELDSHEQRCPYEFSGLASGIREILRSGNKNPLNLHVPLTKTWGHRSPTTTDHSLRSFDRPKNRTILPSISRHLILSSE